MNEIESLKNVIQKLHGCASAHVESVPVKENYQGKPVWEGVVEVFDLTGHPKAKRCYAWASKDGKETRYVAVLALPPATSPIEAVRTSIARDFRAKEPK